MSGFGVAREALRAAAEQARTAGEQVQPAGPSGEVSRVGEALPGTDAVRAVQGLAVLWTGDLDAWRDDMERHAENKAASEVTYGMTDAAERDRFAGGGADGQHRGHPGVEAGAAGAGD